ncbi:MAG: hypothetical protein GY925_26295, partial [Actinomycetia bacterium]|nr:hypothetical protein [Actinomycetes bacterium]
QAVADANAALDEVGGGDPFTSLDDLARNSLWRAWLVDHARGTDGPPVRSGPVKAGDLQQAIIRARLAPSDLNAIVRAEYPDHVARVELCDWESFVDDHQDRAAFLLAHLDHLEIVANQEGPQ